MDKPNTFLRLARLNAGLTQEEVAEELDISSMTVYRWETGQRIPSHFFRMRLCALFGKSEQELGWSEFDEEEPMIIGETTLFDPSVPMGRPVLAGQRVLLKTMFAHCQASLAFRSVIGLVGLPGSGKTAVATALIAMPQFQQTFTGVLWATVGQVSTPRRHLQRWASLLGIETLPEDLLEAREVLRMAIGARRMLIVLDDLWDAHDMLAYQIGGPQCQYLLTTRQTSLANKVCDVVYRPAPLTTIQALHLLSSGLPPVYAREYHSALQTVVAQVGNLPLALELAVGYLRHEASTDSQRRIQAAVSQLAYPAYYLQNRGSREQGSLFTAIQRSEQWLSATARQALLCLATHFPAAPSTFSEHQALEFLRMQDLQIHDLDHLLDAGLVDAVGESRYQFHPVISAYVRFGSA